MSARTPSAPLLSTKLHALDPHGRLGRGALLDRLIEASPARLVLIRAPAGWGKSTLLSQWRLAEMDRRAFAWLTLDRWDSDPVRFWRYVIEALRRAAPSIGSASLPLLDAPGVDLTQEMVPALVLELSDLRAPVVLALDDYHQIEGETVHEAVRALLEFLPPTVTVAVATREEPPFSIARLRARGQLVELDIRTLRFSRRETHDLLNRILELGLADDDVARLHDLTEGWPAGLYLAALSLRDRSDRRQFVAGFAGSDRHIVDFLLEEVLHAQSTAVRRFMVHSSILERMSGPLCDAVLQSTGSAGLLDWLARSNLFVVELDDRRHWYRYHHLLQACLQAELKRETPQLAGELHRRAAGWYLEHEDLSEAVHHTIAAADYDAARELIAEHWAPTLMISAGDRTVEQWLAELPAPVVASDLRLCVARSYIALSMGRVDVVARWLSAAETAPLRGPFRDGFSSPRGAVACVRAGYHWLTGDVAQAVAAAEDVLTAELPTSPWRGIGHAVLALTAAARADWPAARRSMSAWAQIGRAAGQAVPEISALSHSSAWATELGEWDTAATEAEAALTMAAEQGYAEHWICAAAHFARARLLERTNELDRATAEMGRALELARRGAGPATTAWMLTHFVRLLVTCNDPAAARQCLEEARAALALAPDAGAVGGLVAATERQLRGDELEHASEEVLSGRELEVLRLLATKQTQREIGSQLYLSVNTVKAHTRNIFRKLDVSSRAAAVARARELRLI